MIKHWLTIFNILAKICSNNAPQFTGGWLKGHVCLHGCTACRSVAHLSRSDGRAEGAGCQVFVRLCKLHLENPKKSWFREMWRAIQAYHNLPTPSGLCTHQNLLPRDRLSGSLPWYTTGLAKDAVDVFKRAKDTAKLVKDTLEKEHAKRQDKTPKGPVTSIKVGGHDWLKRPRPLGSHPTKTWYTPGTIAKRVCPSTVLVQTGPSQFKTRQETQVKDRVPDITGKHVDSSEDEYLEGGRLCR